MVGKIIFEPNHQSTVIPGNAVIYAHKLSSDSAGSVVFNSSDGGSAATGWNHGIYLDANCNGALESAEAGTEINGVSFNLLAGDTLCIIDKVNAATNVTAQSSYLVTTTADFSYAASVLPNISKTVEDVTTALQAGSSTLDLTKTVENITHSTAETQTLNQANPGDILRYRVYYQNTGTGPIDDLVINDSVPAYTALVTASNVCATTPASLVCAPSTLGNDLKWNSSGVLAGGDGGHISFEVVVDE